jgi:hypothetical protein
MNQLTDRERALAIAMAGWLLTYLSAPEDHQRMASVFGFVLAFCYKAHLEDHLSEDDWEPVSERKFEESSHHLILQFCSVPKSQNILLQQKKR